MKTIWKFPLALTGEQDIPMPRGSKILAVQVQGEQVCIWALVSPDAIRELRTFYVIGTGHPLPDEASKFPYLGTFQLLRGALLVFHVFEEA